MGKPSKSRSREKQSSREMRWRRLKALSRALLTSYLSKGGASAAAPLASDLNRASVAVLDSSGSSQASTSDASTTKRLNGGHLRLGRAWLRMRSTEHPLTGQGFSRRSPATPLLGLKVASSLAAVLRARRSLSMAAFPADPLCNHMARGRNASRSRSPCR